MTTLDFNYVFFARPSIARGDIKKTGTPIYMRIKYKEKQKVVATGIKGPHDKWAKHLQRFNCDSLLARKANKKLDDMSRFIDDRYWRLENEKEEYDLNTLIVKITGREEIITLLSFYEKRFKEIKALEDKKYSKGTVKIYNNTLNHLKAFFKHLDISDIPIKQIKHGFVADFYEYLLLKVSPNTANKILRKLKAMMGYALKREMIDQHPFRDWEIRDEKVHRQALSQTELKKLLEIESLHPGIIKVRDVFIFQSLTGLAHVDVNELEHKHIITEGENIYIDKIRHKTNNRAIIPLLPTAIQILNRYKDFDSKKALPVYTLQTMNKYLKGIAKLAQIDKPLTTHIGRHTFATTITLENGVAREHLESMMALSSSRMVHVYAKMTASTVNNAMRQATGNIDL